MGPFEDENDDFLSRVQTFSKLDKLDPMKRKLHTPDSDSAQARVNEATEGPPQFSKLILPFPG